MANSRQNGTNLAYLLTVALSAPLQVGGQAVIEGVMMRSPHAMAVAVRCPDGEIAVRNTPWRSFSEKLPLLKKPLLRGSVVLIEAMMNGIEALNFSARKATEDPDTQEGDKGELSGWAITGTMIFSFVLGLALFVVVPHFLSAYLLRVAASGQGVKSFVFHAMDGIIKMSIFLGYVLAIRRLEDIKRVFQYHGAEHKSIYTYEAGKDLCVENARPFSTLHPRCGTAFIMVVLMVSIGVFAITLPFIPVAGSGYVKATKIIMIKLGLMLPIAGISYEIIRWAARSTNPILKLFILPGILMQKITTSPPSDDQLEVGLEALRQALETENAFDRRAAACEQS